MSTRSEFGVERVSCACRTCRRNCIFLPGFLIPADLDRILPPGQDPLPWAEINLLASPGAKVMKNLQIFRIGTLVPATKPDGSCIHYQKRSCQIWDVSPFGCAFFGCGGSDEDRLSQQGLKQVWGALADPHSLYHRLWHHLWNLGRRQDAPEVVRARMEGAR